MRLAALRVAEALTNGAKYAHATTATVSVDRKNGLLPSRSPTTGSAAPRRAPDQDSAGSTTAYKQSAERYRSKAPQGRGHESSPSYRPIDSREWVLYGVFFTILAPAQAIWGVLVVRRPEDRRLLAAGGAVNLAVACVWMISRTTGIPVGPTPWRPEAIGWHDVMATLNELAMAVIVVGMLGMLPLSEERLAHAARYVAVPLLVSSVLSASLAHQH